jgi:hypothetical protein
MPAADGPAIQECAFSMHHHNLTHMRIAGGFSENPDHVNKDVSVPE